MKKRTLLFALLLGVSTFGGESKAQCTSYFQSLYNPSSGDMDFTTLCTYDTSVHPILYQWDFGDGTGVFGENPSHHYATANAYLVCLMLYVGNGAGCCQDTFCELVDFAPTAITKTPGCISDLAISSTQKNVTLFVTLTQTQHIQMSMVMMNGTIIPVNVSSSMMKGRNQIDLELPDYPAGIYLLRIEDIYGNSVSKRFMIY
jgi:hypothetical protein